MLFIQSLAASFEVRFALSWPLSPNYRWFAFEMLGFRSIWGSYGKFMMKYALHISRLIWDDWLFWPVVFLANYVGRLLYILKKLWIMPEGQRGAIGAYCHVASYHLVKTVSWLGFILHWPTISCICGGYWCILVATYRVMECLYCYVVQNSSYEDCQ
jgi:hypothetical protein